MPYCIPSVSLLLTPCLNFAMCEKATGLELFHVLKTAVIDSKVTSVIAVQSVSDEAIVNEDKTILIEHPDTESKEGEHDKRIRIPEV